MENAVGIHSRVHKNVWEEREDEAAVGSIQLQELLRGSVSVAFRSLSHSSFYIRASACPRVLRESKLLPRGRQIKRQLSVFYIYISMAGDRQS